MRRQVDHHLARARAIGRRASAQARAPVWESLEAVQRAVTRMHEGVTIDSAGEKAAEVRIERQDLDEMLGNLVENAAKYGSGRVFVTVEKSAPFVDILVEDDGPGIPAGIPAGGGFGQQLIQALTKQLKGSYTLENTNGARYHFSIPYQQKAA